MAYAPPVNLTLTIVEKPDVMLRITLFATTIIACNTISAQQNAVTQKTCADVVIQKQADSVKKQLISGGFSLLREAMITMESEYEVPVIVPLKAGEWYQFVFIGDAASGLYEVRMYDYNEQQVVFKK